MTGARMTSYDAGGDDNARNRDLYLVQGDDASAAEVIAIHEPRHQPGDPNQSYELQEMVSLAITYFDRGMLDDAEELLHEALAGGYSLPDGQELQQKLHAVRGQTALVAQPQPSPADTPLADTLIFEFTQPLPGVETQSPSVRRSIDDSERDLQAGRLYAAHDATLRTIALAPSYMPMYIRLIELRQAMGDLDGANELTDSLKVVLRSMSEESDWLTQSMRVTLDPDNTDALVQLARSLLDQRDAASLEPFVPDAIERTLYDAPEVALGLATDYVQLRPSQRDAQRLHLRAVVAVGDTEQIRSLVQQQVQPDSSADLLFLRASIAYAEGREQWFSWLERAVGRILDADADGIDLTRVIDAARNLLSGPQHGLATAVIRIATGDDREALTALAPWAGTPGRETSDAHEMLVAAAARALALRRISPIEAIQAFSDAVGQSVVIDVRPFAESSRLFPKPISAESLMNELVAIVRETGQHELAIAHLQTLRDRLPEHLEIRTGLADLQIAAGRTAEGIRELRHIAERYEQVGNIDKMVEAMRHISAAVPNNIEMKAKLIEGYIQRGVPEDAMQELRQIGDLYLKRRRAGEAAAAYVRGAEIAATTGNTRRAMDLFERAITAAPENVGFRHAAVAFYIMSGAVDKATEQLSEVVRIALQEQDPDEAVAALHQIIGLSPGEAAAYHKLGEVLTSLGEYAQAERVYRRLAAFTDDDPVLAAKQSALAALAADQ